MNKRSLIVILLVLVSLSYIFSAGRTETSGVTLRVAYPGWDTKEQEKAVTDIVTRFELENPNIKIELENYPWSSYHDSLMIQLQSGNGPDLGYNPARWVPEWYKFGYLKDLSPHMSAFEVDDWYEDFWDSGLFNGKNYSIPGRREPYGFFYNVDLFKRAGISKFPETMDEFIATAKKLTSGDTYGFGMIMATDATFAGPFLNFIYALGGEPLIADGTKSNLASPKMVDAVKFFTDMYSVLKITQPSAVSDTRAEVRQLFAAGKVGMVIEGLWATGTIEDMAPDLNWAVGQIPRASGEPNRNVTGGWDWVIYEHTDKTDAAVKFIQFITSPDNMAMAEVTLPSRRSALENARFSGPEYLPWIEAMEYGKPEPKTMYFSNIFDDILNNTVQSIVLNKIPVSEAMANAHAKASAVLTP